MPGSSLFIPIRVDVGDDLPPGSGELYADSSLVVFIGKALNRINGFVGTAFTVDASGVVTPTQSAKQEDATLLVTECLISRREARRAARKGIRAKQDENTIDTTGQGRALSDLATSVCNDARAALDELVRDTAGAATYGEIIWAGNERLFEVVDFGGTGFGTIENEINDDLAD